MRSLASRFYVRGQYHQRADRELRTSCDSGGTRSPGICRRDLISELSKIYTPLYCSPFCQTAQVFVGVIYCNSIEA
jgi:hypothetical protein